MFALLLHEAINILCHFSPTLIKELHSEILQAEWQEGENLLHNEESLIKI